MTMNEHELQVLRNSKVEINLERTPYDCLMMRGDRRAKALFEERKDLDINSHYGNVDTFKLGPGTRVLDIGAYIGDSTIAYLRAGCSVIACEAFLDAFLCLLYNTRPHKDRVTIYNVAVGNGEMVHFDHSYEGNDHGCRFVHPSQDGVKTVLIDDLVSWSWPQFIKIDVEGHELHVLSGAGKTIAKSRPKMFIESYPEALKRQGATPKDLHDLIAEMGYTICDGSMTPFTRTDYTSMVDLVCIPK